MMVNKRPSLFYIVTFIETPFEGIDEYVCVPRLWLILQRSSGHQRAVVTYPNNEDPLDTRDRVRRRERPNDKWRFYVAIIKYESDYYEDAEDWIALNNHERGEEESEIRDTLPEPVVNKRLRSARQPSSSGSNSDKTRLTVERKRLPIISIRCPLSQKTHNLENKGLKLNGNAKAGSSKKEKSIIITDTQFIQNYQTETNPASNDKTNTEQSNQLVVIKETQSVEMSGQSALAKLLAEQQPPPNLSAQQQLSLQPQPGRQSPPKLTVEQQLFPKLPGEQLSPVGQDNQPPLSMSIIDPNESGEDIEGCKNVMHESVMEERPPTRTRPNTLEQTPQPESVKDGSTPLDSHEHSIPESHSRDISAGQSREPKEVFSDVNKMNLTTLKNLTQDNQQTQSKIPAEKDLVDKFDTLFTELRDNLSLTRDLFKYLRNSILDCTQTYKILLENVNKLNSMETLHIPTSQPNSVMSQVLQVPQERPGGDNDNNTGVGDAPTPISNQRGKFSLPAEYDPNDTKWTLKYRNKKPGLVELMPQTGVYVSGKALKRCIRESNDCRTLARMLLTDVFSKNALSVCSWTGGRAKAFNSVNIDVRPGLDEHARMVLLAFVEKHGKKRGWNTSDTLGIMSTIRTKIYDIRAKHSQTCRV